MSVEHLIEGLDPTGLDCISKADILQMIRAAKPVDGEGFIHWSDDAPDVVTNPEMASFFWGKTTAGVKNKNEIYFYDGTSWELFPVTITDGSISLAKLSLTGSNPFYIIQVNAAGNALIWTSVANAIQNNTLPPAKLLIPGAVDNYILTSFAGVKAFTELSAFFAAIANGIVPITKLAFGGANTFMRMNPGATSWIATTADIADLLAAGYSAGQGIKRNAGNTGWTPYTPALSAYPTFIAPVQIYSGADSGGWQTKDLSGTLNGTNAHTAILQAAIQKTSSADGNCLTEIRKDSGSSAMLLDWTGDIDGGAGGGQGFFPIHNPGYLLDYKVTVNAGTFTDTIKIVGYLS